ncbi:uncharacterized protein LOC128295389 [Gossypium arboreum]|uniref:uncharacterized protein LOC128295389 n=1 Tax=Gossypium arboreum TaxID=29729 RepID=UPI0022F19C47|nr:uncharacterized protein LOC128295389 [Gossypium arboreum]
MEGCLAVNAEGKSGGLVMMWKESKKVEIQTYSSNHIDALVHMKNESPIRFTGFYGNADPNRRQTSWNMLKRVGQTVTGKWIIGGDFNAILDEAEKEGGRRKPKVLMEEFRTIVDELAVVDLKTDNGWVIRQSSSDHDAISLDTEGRRPRDGPMDPRLCFRYEVCWARNEAAKTIIKGAWQRGNQDIMEKITNVGKELGRWQYKKLKQLRNKIGSLQADINRIIDGQGSNNEGKKLKICSVKIGATNRRKKNNIARLKDTNGSWRDNNVDICKAIREYFQLLFKSNFNSNSELNLDYVEKCISGTAFSQMDPRKAPGIDGLSGHFFKENWDVVGADVINLCLDILRGVKDVDCLNDTIIVLIPKVKDPVDMTNFRPISLCRVIYKIIAKVLANRLKETLPLCISQNQSAFVPGRMIHDNILIAHELVHYLQSAKNGPNKGFVVKLDMSKAYNWVEWNFIEEVMKKMGYVNDWESKIMRCVRSYNNMLKGIRASRNGPRINHLFFADDALLFVRNKKRDVEELVSIIAHFSRASGQEINKDKSMILFSPKTPRDSRLSVSSLLGMRTVEKLDSYLGLPLPVGRKKSLAFTDIINRCTCRVKSWSKHLLSYGGKEVFIKAIIQAIPSYAFSVFLAPKGTIEELHSQMGRMWWTNNDKMRGWAMMAWRKMCHPKGMGGMGFRNLYLFNLALLGRQGTYSVISGATSLHSPRQALPKAMNALKDGFIWQVGDGNGIDLRRAHWGLNGIFGESVCRSPLNDNERKVKDLWDQDNRRWKRERVKEIYGDYLGECICNLPIPPNNIKDTRTWLQNPHGIYTSKSAYSWLILKEVGFGPHRFFWRALWKLQMLPKIKIFSWRIGHNILPTFDNIARIRQGFQNICPRCKDREETLIHAMKDCKKAREILAAGGLNNRLLTGEYTNCIDWLEDVFRVLDKKAAADFLTLLWNSWNDRNNMLFKGKMDEAVTVQERRPC